MHEQGTPTELGVRVQEEVKYNTRGGLILTINQLGGMRSRSLGSKVD